MGGGRGGPRGGACAVGRRGGGVVAGVGAATWGQCLCPLCRSSFRHVGCSAWRHGSTAAPAEIGSKQMGHVSQSSSLIGAGAGAGPDCLFGVEDLREAAVAARRSPAWPEPQESRDPFGVPLLTLVTLNRRGVPSERAPAPSGKTYSSSLDWTFERVCPAGLRFCVGRCVCDGRPGCRVLEGDRDEGWDRDWDRSWSFRNMSYATLPRCSLPPLMYTRIGPQVRQ